MRTTGLNACVAVDRDRFWSAVTIFALGKDIACTAMEKSVALPAKVAARHDVER